MEHGHEDELWGEPSAEDVLRRINGYHLDTRGSWSATTGSCARTARTSSGCWIYSGVFKGGVNLSARRGDGPDGKWGWCWPLDRRDPLQPRLGRSAGPARGASARSWSGGTRPSGAGSATTSPTSPTTCRPSHVPPPDAVGPAALRGDDAFVLQADGKAWLFAPNGVVDGPLPTHYEPDESPVVNPLHGPRGNPTRRLLPAARPTRPIRRATTRCSRSCSPPPGSPSTTPRAA